MTMNKLTLEILGRLVYFGLGFAAGILFFIHFL